MKSFIRSSSLLILFFHSIVLFADNPELAGDYWQCLVQDAAGKEWSELSSYKLAAINRALDNCKKQSAFPETCKSSQANCEAFIDGHSTRPMWRCMALDFMGNPWYSNLYRQSDDAALAAKAYCRDNSESPDSCYINFITCANMNARN